MAKSDMKWLKPAAIIWSVVGSNGSCLK
jgi:hypothetical protein